MTLTHQLQTLETSGLIQLAQEQPDLEYLFRHALVQDAAYASLLMAERQQLHVLAGEALERLFADRLAEFAPRLGHHFLLAGEKEKALHYLVLAGDTAVAAHANLEATSYYKSALQIAHKSTLDSAWLTHIYVNLGRAYELLSQFEVAMAVYEEMDTLADERADRPLKLATLIAKTKLYIAFTPLYNPVQGEDCAQEALTLATELHDPSAKVAILRSLLNLYRFSGQLTKAMQYAEEALALAQQQHLQVDLAYVLNDVAYLYFVYGRLSQAIDASQQATELWREFNNQAMLADSLATATYVHIYSGHYSQAIAAAEEALSINQAINNLWGQCYSQQVVGVAYWQQGRPAQAITSLQNSIQLSVSSGLIVPQATTQADLAKILASLGDIDQGLAKAEAAVHVAETKLSNLGAFRAYALSALATIQAIANRQTEASNTIRECQYLLHGEDDLLFTLLLDIAGVYLAYQQGDFKQVIHLAEAVLAKSTQFGTIAYNAEVFLLQAQAMGELGEETAVFPLLHKAKAAAEKTGSQWLRWQILAELGNKDEARHIVQKIIENTPEVLRPYFLNTPRVQKLLEST